jgi:hypothetical protein
MTRTEWVAWFAFTNPKSASVSRASRSQPGRGFARVCGFKESDDASLYADILARVRLLIGSPDQVIARLGSTFALRSRFTDFAGHLWPLLEDNSQHVRLGAMRLEGTGLTLAQLGHGASDIPRPSTMAVRRRTPGRTHHPAEAQLVRD